MQTAMIIMPSGETRLFKFTQKNCLEIFQEHVGGLIQPIDMPKQGWNMVVNEEGKMHQLPYNEFATHIWESNYGMFTDAILGTVVMTSIEVGDDGETIGLTLDDVANISQMLNDYRKQWGL
jgi:hypothetical protein